MWPKMKLEVSSTLFLRVLFSGNYERGCGFAFNILDDTRQNLYHLDFRLNIKHRYRRLIQASKFNGTWGYKTKEIDTKLPDLTKDNGIYIRLTDKYYEVTVNNIAVTSKFPIHLERLHTFKRLMVFYYGSCIRIDLNTSYMKNGGNDLLFTNHTHNPSYGKMRLSR